MEMLRKQLELFNALLQSGMTNIGTGWPHVDIPSEMWEATPTGSNVLHLSQQRAETITSIAACQHSCWRSWHWPIKSRMSGPPKHFLEVTLAHRRATRQALPSIFWRWHWPIEEPHVKHSILFKEVTLTHKELHVGHSIFLIRWHWPIEEPHVRYSHAFKKVTLTHKSRMSDPPLLTLKLAIICNKGSAICKSGNKQQALSI